MTTWEAYGGMMLIPAGKKRSGKPRSVLAIQLIVCVSESDMRALKKQQPHLKFIKRTRRASLVRSDSHLMSKPVKGHGK